RTPCAWPSACTCWRTAASRARAAVPSWRATTTSGASIWASDPCPTVRSMTDLPRNISLVGASNFRDLGGYAAQDGRQVRWRRLFRSDHLAGLSPQDAQALAALGLARAVDLRGHDESSAQAYQLPSVR